MIASRIQQFNSFNSEHFLPCKLLNSAVESNSAGTWKLELFQSSFKDYSDCVPPKRSGLTQKKGGLYISGSNSIYRTWFRLGVRRNIHSAWDSAVDFIHQSRSTENKRHLGWVSRTRWGSQKSSSHRYISWCGCRRSWGWETVSVDSHWSSHWMIKLTVGPELTDAITRIKFAQFFTLEK